MNSTATIIIIASAGGFFVLLIAAIVAIAILASKNRRGGGRRNPDALINNDSGMAWWPWMAGGSDSSSPDHSGGDFGADTTPTRIMAVTSVVMDIATATLAAAAEVLMVAVAAVVTAEEEVVVMAGAEEVADGATGMSGWETILQSGLGLVFPEVCQLCESERATARDGFVGPRCWSQVRFIRPPFCDRCGLPFDGELTTTFVCTNCHDLHLHFTSARSAVVAKAAVLEAIHRFKYSRALWFENFLADLLLREAVPALKGQPWDGIIPVPLHPLKRREREFNQAEILARHLGQALNIPVETKILRRVSPTLTQTKLTREQRASNMNGAFAVREGGRLDGKKFILLDDVFTTGATTNACAGPLRAAGAAEVCVWTVARGL